MPTFFDIDYSLVGCFLIFFFHSSSFKKIVSKYAFFPLETAFGL